MVTAALSMLTSTPTRANTNTVMCRAACVRRRLARTVPRASKVDAGELATHDRLIRREAAPSVLRRRQRGALVWTLVLGAVLALVIVSSATLGAARIPLHTGA